MNEPSLHDHDHEAWSFRQFRLAVEDERDYDSSPGETTSDFYARRARASAADVAARKQKRNSK